MYGKSDKCSVALQEKSDTSPQLSKRSDLVSVDLYFSCIRIDSLLATIYLLSYPTYSAIQKLPPRGYPPSTSQREHN